MTWFKTIGATCVAALMVAGCTTDPIAPNIQDPNGPKVRSVSISYCIDLGQGDTGINNVVCYPSVTLQPGTSAQLTASARNGDQDLTSQCAWVWSSKSKAVTIRVSQPSQQVIVTKNPFNISGQLITVTATCNGVTGSYNIL